MFVKYQKAVCLSGVLALAATFASANAGTISEPVAKIHGTIFQLSGVDPDSTPIPAPNARVWLFNADTNQLVAQTTADPRGRFNLSVYEGGKYVIKASKRGSGSARETLKVNSGDSIETKLVLKN